MSRFRPSSFLLILLAAFVLGAAKPPKDADQVRDRRLAYTKAIMAREPSEMREFLTEDMVQLSSNAQTTSGRDAVIQAYTDTEFRNPSFIVYERKPDTVVISENRRFAVERGHWQGRFRQPDGTVTGNSGLYQAGWIKREGAWLIRTESYVRLHCSDENDCPK